MLATFAVTGRVAWSHKSATYDEPLHFVGAWLQTHYGDFRCNPEDPPLWKYYVAAGTRAADMKPRPGTEQLDFFAADILFHGDPANDPDALIAAGRARMILLGVVLGILIAWWAWRLSGPVAAMVAIAAFCLDPNFLAHAPLIKNDVPITLVFVALMATIWLLGERVTPLRWLTMSLLLGAALTTKFTGVLAIPMMVAALFLRAIFPQSWPIVKWNAVTRRRRLLAAAAMGAGSLMIAYAMIWAVYDFRFLPTTNHWADPGLAYVDRIWAEHQELLAQPNPRLPESATTSPSAENWQPDSFIRAIQWIYTKRLLPENWIVGFVYTRAQSLVRPAFLCGRTSLVGWWYYFPLAMSFKTPLATLTGIFLAVILGIARIARGIRWRRLHSTSFRGGFEPHQAWALCAAAVAPILYFAVAMHTHLNLGIRHILPVYPFLYIMLGVVAARAWRRRPKITGWIAGILLLGLAMETYNAFPDYIPFFNFAAGGSRGGLRLLGDSNIDWGQELPDLADWQAKHQDRRLYLAYFGATTSLGHYAIHYTPMTVGADESQAGESSPRLPAVYAISAVDLQGQYQTPAERKLYEPFRNKTPTAVLGGSLYLFDSQ